MSNKPPNPHIGHWTAGQLQQMGSCEGRNVRGKIWAQLLPSWLDLRQKSALGSREAIHRTDPDVRNTILKLDGPVAGPQCSVRAQCDKSCCVSRNLI